MKEGEAAQVHSSFTQLLYLLLGESIFLKVLLKGAYTQDKQLLIHCESVGMWPPTCANMLYTGIVALQSGHLYPGFETETRVLRRRTTGMQEG